MTIECQQQLPCLHVTFCMKRQECGLWQVMVFTLMFAFSSAGQQRSKKNANVDVTCEYTFKSTGWGICGVESTIYYQYNLLPTKMLITLLVLICENKYTA